MADTQQENAVKQEVLPQNGNSSAVVVEQKLSQNPEAKPENKPEPEMSKGEKVFDKAVYTGLNYWVNLISSVAIADYFVNGNGKEKLNKAISKTTQFLTKSNVVKDIKTAHHHSKVGWETLALTGGGFILLAPLKWLEDRKRPVVHKINKKLGVKQIAPDGHEETPDEIHIVEEQPKQSWGNVLWRRLVGMGAVVGSGMTIDHFLADKNTPLAGKTYDLGFSKVTYDAKILGGKDRITRNAFAEINKAAKIVSGKEFNKKGVVSRWAQLAILDSVFTAITAIVMKVTNGAKRGKMPREIDDSNDPPVVKDAVDNITTTADLCDRAFAERVEKRVNKLVDSMAARSEVPHSFVETLQKKDTPTLGVGV